MAVPKIRFPGFTDAWEQRKLGDILQYEQPQKYIVSSTNYDDSFEIPVLTAGQTFILGYTNESEGVKEASPNKPVIIFDDFTTSSHYVDFPFKIKSSAMKLLTLTNERDNIYFAFEALQNLNYVPQNHERHWISIFSDFDISIPSYGEQQKIGALFKEIDSTITLHQRKLEGMKLLKKSLLQKMFPKSGESVPEVRFPGFTDAWEQRKVKDIAENTYGGGTPQTSIDSYWNGEIPWIQSQDIIENQLFNVEPRKHISEEAISKSATKLVPKNSIAIVTRVGVGKLAFMPFSYCTSQDFLSLSGIQIDEKYATYSIYQMLQKEKQNVQGTSIKGITIEEMLSKKIPVPCNSDEQGAIGAFFHNLDTLITLHQRKLETLQKMKKSLLQKMFV